MSNRGHNENAMRLSILADDAKAGLGRVAAGEAEAIEGWFAYGAALNEGRSLFPGDREFGEWLRSSNLEEGIHPADQSAAMWAAANREQFNEAQNAGKARTVRGIHAKWKEIEADRERERREAERKAEQAKAAEEAKAKREEAKEHATAEESARKAAEKATDDNERKAAEDKAAKEAQAKEEAEKAAVEAEQAASGGAEEAAPDPHAKLRREFRAMTPEAQEDDWIAMRNEHSEGQKRIAKQRGEIADLKAQIKTLTSGDDMGRKIGNLQRQLTQSEGRSKEHQANAARLQRQVNAQKAEIAKLRKSLEGQEIAL